MSVNDNIIIDRKLPERAQLKFYFPNPSEGKKYFTVLLPFFENPEIKETKKAKLKKYNLIARSSNLYGYQGASSRKIQLTFFMTLPHIIDEASHLTAAGYSDAELGNPEYEKEKFKSPVAAPPSVKNSTYQISQHLFQDLPGLRDSATQVLNATNWGERATQYELDYIKTLYGLTNTDPAAVAAAQNEGQGVGSQTVTTYGPPAPNPPEETDWSVGMIEKIKVIDTIIYWVNIIRSSVTNNAQNPLYGPPMVRLRHGVMYQDVPCLCTGYNINIEEKMGYDLRTLMPRRLKISMTLEENRTGDFGKFDQNHPIKKDNLAGWEAVITGPQSMDPGYTF